jgi:hypothetical protein
MPDPFLAGHRASARRTHDELIVRWPIDREQEVG